MDGLSRGEAIYLKDLLEEDIKRMDKYYKKGAQNSDLISANYGEIISMIRSIEKKLGLNSINKG